MTRHLPAQHQLRQEWSRTLARLRRGDLWWRFVVLGAALWMLRAGLS